MLVPVLSAKPWQERATCQTRGFGKRTRDAGMRQPSWHMRRLSSQALPSNWMHVLAYYRALFPASRVQHFGCATLRPYGDLAFAVSKNQHRAPRCLPP